MKWSVEQKKSIETRDKNLLVSASAGSGKTAVLVERIIDLCVDEEVDIDRFLVVTFTKAAASEMKERISKGLASKFVVYPQKVDFIKKQIWMLHNSNISTIHSFCKNLIKKYFYLLDIEPNFKIGSREKLSLLTDEALDSTMDFLYTKAIENPDDKSVSVFNKVMKNFSNYKSDDVFRSLIINIYRHSVVQPYPKKWLDKIYNQDITIIFERIIKMVLEELNFAIRELNLLVELSSEIDGPSAYVKTLDSDIKYIENVYLKYIDNNLSSIELDFIFEFMSDLNSIKFVRRASIKKDDAENVCVHKKTIVENNRELIKRKINGLIKDFASQNLEFQEQIISHTNEMYKIISDIVLEYTKRFKAIKKRHNLLDFNDLEHFAIELLNDENVRSETRAEYRYIFIDEYQDTNLVQEEISNLLRSERNLFLVGDVKQSIYGFRKAEPRLFLEKFDSFKILENADRIDLNANYRSSPMILKSINTVFDGLMTKEFGGVDYAKDSRLIAGRVDFELESKSVFHAVDLSTAAYSEEIDEDVLGSFNAYLGKSSVLEIEIDYVVKRIGEILKEKMYDSKQNKIRNIRTGDIVILSRTLKGVEEIIQKKLSEAGYSSISDEESNFFEIVEISTIINMLRILDNVRQDIALISVMRSHLGSFNDDELLAIRTNSNSKQSSYYDAIIEYINENNDIISKKLSAFMSLLQDIRDSEHLKLSDIIKKIIRINNYSDYVKGLEDGERRFYHLELLIDKTIEFEEQNDLEIHGFINYLDRLKSSEIPYSSKSGFEVEQNSIRIMSIHKSKGLEFPVVLLVNCSKEFNFIDTYARIILDTDLDIASKYVLEDKYIEIPTIKYNLIKLLKTKEIKMEEQRLLYVAMTRAVNRLECFGTIKGKHSFSEVYSSNSTEYELYNSKNYTKWILGTIYTSIGNEWDVNVINPFDIFSSCKDSMRTNHNVDLQSDLNLSCDVKEIKLSRESFEDELQIRDIKLFPTKIGVSELNKTIGIEELLDIGIISYPIDKEVVLTDEYISSLIFEKSSLGVDLNRTSLVKKVSQVEDFEEQKSKYGGAIRGNAYHHAMELLVKEYFEISKRDRTNIQFKKQDVYNILQSFLEKNIISQEEFEFLDVSKIADFFESEYFKKLSKAQKVFLEKSFVYKIEKDTEHSILIQGVLDAIFIIDNSIHLIDYKTDRIFVEDEFINKYRMQLYIYELAIKSILGMEVVGNYLYSFNLGKFLEL